MVVFVDGVKDICWEIAQKVDVNMSVITTKKLIAR